jgi:hypothetical protein
MKSFEQKAAKTTKAAAAEYAAGAGFVLIRNPGIFAGGVDMSLLRCLRELLFKPNWVAGRAPCLRITIRISVGCY